MTKIIAEVLAWLIGCAEVKTRKPLAIWNIGTPLTAGKRVVIQWVSRGKKSKNSKGNIMRRRRRNRPVVQAVEAAVEAAVVWSANSEFNALRAAMKAAGISSFKQTKAAMAETLNAL